jgi:hypothetical protein
LKYSSKTAAIGFAEDGISRTTASSKGGIRFPDCWVFVKKTLTDMNAGVWVSVGGGVRVTVGVGVTDGVLEGRGELVGVIDGVNVNVGV